METLSVECFVDRKAKLISLVNSVIQNYLHKSEIEKLFQKLELKRKDVIQAYLDYNLDIHSFDNEIYNSLSNKMVLHLHNLLEKSWHQDRQRYVLNLLKKIKVRRIIDIGFGVPSRYIKDYILVDQQIKLTLFDLSSYSMKFAANLLDIWEPTWKNVVSMKQGDMCDVHDVGEFDAYLFLDSIEHVPEPTTTLKKYVDFSPEHAYFILSIPIGPIIPVHFMAWKDNEEAERWLNDCGLRIIEGKSIWVNPEVDLFAEPLGNEHHNYIVLCEKIRNL